MRLTKRITKHNIYEIWCEHAAESVFIDHRPSKKESEEIRDIEWPGTDSRGLPHRVQIFKLTHFYTKHPSVYRMERGED